MDQVEHIEDGYTHVLCVHAGPDMHDEEIVELTDGLGECPKCGRKYLSKPE